jgi:anti-anti-sigma factor
MSVVASPRSVDRQARTATALVEIVDTLVSDFDVIDVLTVLTARCVELLEAAAAGILLVDNTGRLRVIGASTEQIQLLELLQIQSDEGPCLDCFRTGRVILNGHLDTESKWPQFASESVRAGFPSVCAVPLRINDVILGCLNLFMSEPVPSSNADVALAQALADVASIAIMQDQAVRDAAIRERQLQHALNSRIAIEQAKGMIAEHDGVEMDDAFSRLRAFARTHNRRRTETAAAVVAGTVAIDSFARPLRSPGTPGPLPRPLELEATDSDVPLFDLSESIEHGSSVIQVSGQLDIATRNRCLEACLGAHHVAVVVDMATLTFMDCAGYGALVAARRALQARGGSLTLRHATGQPARLLATLVRVDPLIRSVAQDFAGGGVDDADLSLG